MKASDVAPADADSGLEFNVDDGAVKALVGDRDADALGLVEAADALHDGIVGVTDGSDRVQDLLKSEIVNAD